MNLSEEDETVEVETSALVDIIIIILPKLSLCYFEE
jgi:hypothetical protein